jgi:hypothetical protein
MAENEERIRLTELRSDFIVGELLGEVEIDGFTGMTKLDAAALRGGTENQDAKAQRFELITAINGGKHVELAVTARTFRQRKTPNRRYLRLSDEKLSARVGTWKGLPYLTDHNTWSMSASKGTILSSKLVEETPTVHAFEQKLHVVKPEAVRGFLDGTYKQFSIGWFPLGPVLCSAHNCDIRQLDSCSCWPGDQVLVDGKPQIVEYVFSDYEGKETSSVVIPAVKDTSVEEVRAALAAELDLPRTRINKNKENRMALHRLAAILGLAALTDAEETRAVDAVEALQRRASTAETALANTRAELAQAQSALTSATAAARGIQVNSILQEHGYGAGKLRYGKDADGKPTPSPMEGWLRTLSAQPNGVELVKTQLSEMPVVVPVGQRPASDGAKVPGRADHGEQALTADNPYLRDAAEQLGLKVEDVVAFGNNHVAGGY